MMDSYFTFLYVRRGNAGVRSIRIHRILALTVAAVSCAVIVAAFVLIFEYGGYVRDADRVASLEQENRELKERIGGFQHKID